MVFGEPSQLVRYIAVPISSRMPCFFAAFLCLITTALASPISKRQVPSFTFDGDAPYSVDAATLAAALTCPNGNPTDSSPPVLLVHGLSCAETATFPGGTDFFLHRYVVDGRIDMGRRLRSSFGGSGIHRLPCYAA